jgi:hypothetical protein
MIIRRIEIMNRKDFLKKSLQFGLCCSGAIVAIEQGDMPANASPQQGDKTSEIEAKKEFIENWLSDLLDTIDAELDENIKVKLMEGCGRGCFRRHQFKRDIAQKGKGNLENLLEALKNNFIIQREGDLVHIRYGNGPNGCYCPVLHNRPPKPNDMHCNCTRATHQAIFEEALGRPFKVEIIETLRRGGKMCHFVVHLS